MNIQFDYFNAYDGLKIRYGTVASNPKAIGSVILLGGRAEFIEKHSETISELKCRGFNVYAMDWRGQGLSRRILKDRQKGFVSSYDDYVLDLWYFIKQHVISPPVRPIIILAHSMGGHIALRFLHDHPGIIDKAVLLSPMIDINTSPLPPGMVRWFIQSAKRHGLSKEYIVFAKNYNPSNKHFKNNRLTSDPVRFFHERQSVAENPQLSLGGVTYGWLWASFASIDILFNPDYTIKISLPVLIMSGSEERVVSLKALSQFAKWLPDCEHVSIDGARHEILKENDGIREKFWIAFDRFVKK